MNTRRPRVAPRPTSSRSGRRSRDLWIGIPLIVLAIALIAGLIGTYAFLAQNRPTLDADTGCPITGPSAVTAILFDRTDPINDKQKLFIQNKLDALREATRKYEQVDTYSLEDQGDNVVRPLQRLCDPGRGTDVSSLTGNPKLLHERWRTQFDEPLRQMLESMQQGGGSKTSAIFEAIQSVSLQSFQSSKLTRQTLRRLILISDLVQFTKTLDFYRSDLNYRAFHKSNEAQRVHTNLAGVTVEVLFLPRLAPSERRNRLVNFWASWFLDQGAREEGFKVFWVEG